MRRGKGEGGTETNLTLIDSLTAKPKYLIKETAENHTDIAEKKY